MSVQMGKTGFRILAWITAGLAVAGIVLPLLPTTPFALLSAFFASKSSPTFAAWLERHPVLGPAIDRWRRNRAVPRRAKVLACVMMIFSWTLLWLAGSSAVVLAGSGICMAAAASYLLTRPSC